MSSIFTKIIDREIPGHFVYEDDTCVAIMDKFPAVKGQTVIIPKEEVAYAFDLDDETYTHLLQVAKKVAKASDKALNAERTCLVIEGFDVPHVHIKLFPVENTETALGNIMTETAEATDEDLAVVATQIQAALEE